MEIDTVDNLGWPNEEPEIVKRPKITNGCITIKSITK